MMNTASTLRPSRREMAQAMREFATPHTATGVRLFAVDLALFLAGMAVALFTAHPLLRAAGAVLAGARINGLYTLAHDAGHGVLTTSKRLNRLLALLGYLPALYNHRLWHYDHQVFHHVKTNGPQIDVWRPMSLAAYRAAAWYRRAWERFVRAFNPLGFALYIAYHSRVEQHKFMPRKAFHPAGVRAAAWPTTLVLLAYLGALLGWMAWRNAGLAGFALDVGFGLVLPFFVFMNAVAMGAYLQHTHPDVPWFLESDEAKSGYDQAALAVDFRMPGWLDTLAHEALAHPAHHVLPAIPCYRLREAQNRLASMLGSQSIESRGADLLSIYRRCKLYDFENRRWLDFAGNPTTLSVPLPGAGYRLQGASARAAPALHAHPPARPAA